MYDLSDNLYSFTSDATKLYHNEKIIDALKANKIRQTAIYSFNPSITHRKLDELKKFICDRLNNSLSEDHVYVLETSPILNLYNREDWLSHEAGEDCFLGTLNAYKYYGKLLGSVLFDLFTQLPEYKKPNHHNFFDSNSRNFLRHFKTINNLLLPTEFKVGLVSFYGKMFGIERFIIDAPYKEYYEIYDEKLKTEKPTIGSLIQIDENVKLNDSERWFYIKYKKTSCNKFIYKYELSDQLKSEENLIGAYLPLLHTAIFYEPDLYSEGEFITPTVSPCTDMSCKDSIEVLYLFKKVNYGGFDGVTHLAVWRRCDTTFPALDKKAIKNLIESAWEKHYRLIEPELKATLISILQEETKNQATRAAISQVMARNMSHNIGSHVLAKYKSILDFPPFDDNIYTQKQYYCGIVKGLKNKDAIAYFNEYLKVRMDLLADIATTDPSMETPMYFLKEVMSGIDKNRILLDRISGLSDNVQFQFSFKKDGKELGTHEDFLVSIPNDILGCQAFYIIIENIIRNVCKHSKSEKLNFCINVEICDFTENLNYFEVSIYDSLGNLDGEVVSELVQKRNSHFKDSIISPDTNSLRSTNLGTIEMDVCAAYLRKVPTIKIEDDLFQLNEDIYNIKDDGIKIPNLIRACKFEIPSNQYSLGYKFFLRKPQTLLIIDDENFLNISDIKALRKDGIWILTTNKFNPKTHYGHEFLIWCNESEHNEFTNQHYGVLPKRVLCKSDFGDNGFTINIEKPIETYKIVWKIWGEKILKNNAIKQLNYIISNNPDDTKSFPICQESSNNEKTIYLSNHGINVCLEKLKDKYVELCCSHHKLMNEDYILNKISSSCNKNQILNAAKYIETIFTKILIIDERIQGNLFSKTNDSWESRSYANTNIKFYDYFLQQGIIISTPMETNLNTSSFGSLSKNNSEANKIKAFIKKHIDSSHFCVIHLGVLEKMFEIKDDKDDKEITSLLLSILDNKEKMLQRIIIISGRGKPPSLPKECCFLPLSSVQNAVETLFDKYVLTQLLFNSRTPN